MWPAARRTLFPQRDSFGGNPLYRWDYQEKTHFDWWKRRLSHTAQLYDIVRIDHFRGLAGYYAIPAGEKTAEHGQ